MRAWMDDRPRRLQLLVTAVIGAGVASVVFAVASLHRADHVNPGRLLLAAVLLAAGDLAVLHLRFGRERYSFTWSEGAVVFGLVLVPWPWLTVLAALAVASAHAMSGRAPVKVAFNAATMATGVALARGAAGALGGVHQSSMAHQWFVLSVAAGVCFAYNMTAVAAAVAFSQDLRVRQVLMRGAALKLGVFVGNTVVALLLIDVAWNAAAVAAVPLFAVLLYTAYRGYLTAEEDQETWRGLDSASKAMSDLDVANVARQAIEHAVTLLRADAAELYVRQGDGRVGHYLSQPSSPASYEEYDESVLRAMDLVSGVVTSSTHYHDRADELPFMLAVPLESGRDNIGALRLRFRGDVRLSDRERRVLITFARSVAMNLNNALLFQDVRAAAVQHEYAATHDPLTDLPNRTLLMRAAAQACSERTDGRTHALLVLDLDHFKTINDTLGHVTGDRLLISAAQRLRRAVREADLVARLGGDEFAILLSDVSSADDVDAVAQGVLDALSSPVVIDGLRLSIEGSIGISCLPGDAGNVDEMLAHADIALYQAKTSRGTHRRYRADRDDSSISRLALAAELRTALRDDQLVLHYQPQHRLSDGAVIGAEALVRWQHPSRGLLPPSEFVGVAEDSGLAHEFTQHLLVKAIREAASWRQAGHRDVHVAVNLSSRNLLDQDLPSTVRYVLAAHGLPAHLLVLEITETTMMAELDIIEQTLRGLREIGVQLSVDDFGTGYSSLAFLTRNAVNELKVDGGFVMRMMDSESDMAVVRATIDLAHGLGLRVVAEGVETPESWRMLVDMGCDGAQGFLLDEPLPANAFVTRLSAPMPVSLRLARQRTTSPKVSTPDATEQATVS